jgi:hypothetical protein
MSCIKNKSAAVLIWLVEKMEVQQDHYTAFSAMKYLYAKCYQIILTTTIKTS